MNTEGGGAGSLLTVTGMVLQAAPAGEYDRRVVLLTRENGRIACFARSARRQGSPLMAACSPFVFGSFRLAVTRTSYVITEVSVKNYFERLRSDVVTAYYGMYFLEAAEYVTRENNDESQILLLLYRSCQALGSPSLSNRLVRVIFELKLVVLEGEFPGLSETERAVSSESMQYAVRYIAASGIAELYRFQVTEEVLCELESFSAAVCRRFFEREFQSLAILRTMEEGADRGGTDG